MGFMKHAFEMGSVAMMYIAGFIKMVEAFKS
jgi:hypothetical protein